jgi:hypothetical protein
MNVEKMRVMRISRQPSPIHMLTNKKQLKNVEHFKYLANIIDDAISLFLAQQPPVGQGLLNHEVSRSHNTAPQSVGLLWTSDQLVAKTAT